MEGAREIRSLSLRLLAALFQHFPESIDLNPLWPRLLTSIQAVVDRLPIEVQKCLWFSMSSIWICHPLAPFAIDWQKQMLL